ncbi:MAG: L,D-transpeptidase family protein [Tannerella sp.]|nr:L,D-transpeptidase family protein [Tannerella sp.]
MLAIMIIGAAGQISGQDFLSQQKNYSRVRAAIAEKEECVKDRLQRNGLTVDSVHIMIVAYKAEKQLEMYAKRKTDTAYRPIAVYDICASSGKLGPKRKAGDRQVPEGFYRIDRFNPSSNFHLSLGIDYPNLSDRKKSAFPKLGGDIFIHGACVTIGCLPMTDDKIKEIYLSAVYARNNGQHAIPVYIFPFRMDDDTFDKYKKEYNRNPALIDFWTNLKAGYELFQKERKPLQVSTDKDGNYLF